MIIQPVGATYADTYYALRNFYLYRREPPAQAAPVENKPAITDDVVELSAEAQALLAASTK